MQNQKQDMKVGIAVLGTVGKTVAKALDEGIPGLTLAAVAARNHAAASDWLGQLRQVPVITTFEEMAESCDIVVECAPASLLGDIAEPVLKAGKKLIVLSCGGLLNRPDLIDLARSTGGSIHVPTGALLGLDAVNAAAEAEISSVRMITRKPVKGLVGAPFLEEKKIDISSIQEPMQIFSGTAREAAVGFPANLNVAVALSLAGNGPDNTQLEIWADPALTRNTHTIVVESDSARLQMTIENIPTENPKTGRITAQSVLALLRKMNAPLRVGT
ncbi:aspartate dehydrogenase [Paraburkholderia lycopersici]|uniref:L-aspartate dehydrogenase n=1 Tax=Paraburkholderia lycopersici TaxID=416944 RepID=A0A1G6LX15_9BURK|nr:aspartate dehydrogenase [Paraburkholderia lycopersici]SDC47637.1 aspartate dehydrogenase [Paraburkholderia lycopersici]